MHLFLFKTGSFIFYFCIMQNVGHEVGSLIFSSE